MRRYDEHARRREDARQITEPFHGHVFGQMREDRKRICKIDRAGIEWQRRAKSIDACGDLGKVCRTPVDKIGLASLAKASIVSGIPR
jgi:hypothetical protein